MKKLIWKILPLTCPGRNPVVKFILLRKFKILTFF